MIEYIQQVELEWYEQSMCPDYFDYVNACEEFEEVEWCLPLATSVVRCRFHTYVIHLIYYIMFFTPSARNAIKSSAIKNLEIHQFAQQVLVTFNNGKQYLYSNVSEDGIFDLIAGNVKSFGKWVNAYCLNDTEVSSFSLA